MQSITKINFKGVRDTEIILDDTENAKLPKSEKVKSTPSKGGGSRHEDFSNAVLKYIELTIKHFGFADTYQKRVRIKTIEFKHDEKIGLSIRPIFTLNYTDVVSSLDSQFSKINGSDDLKLPYVNEDKKNTGFNKMPEQLQIAAKAVLREAEAFLGGKFAQQDMFGHTDKKETDDESENEDEDQDASDLGSAEDDFKSSDATENEEETV